MNFQKEGFPLTIKYHGGINSSCAKALIHRTFLPIATSVGKPSLSVTPWTEKRAPSSWRITMSSVMGLPNLQERPPPPQTCATTLQSSQVALCGEGRPKEKQKGKARRYRHQRRKRRRRNFLSGTVGLMGWTVFTICLL